MLYYTWGNDTTKNRGGKSTSLGLFLDYLNSDQTLLGLVVLNKWGSESVDNQKKIWKEHMEKLMNVENEQSDRIDASKVEGALRIIGVKEVWCEMN